MFLQSRFQGEYVASGWEWEGFEGVLRIEGFELVEGEEERKTRVRFKRVT